MEGPWLIGEGGAEGVDGAAEFVALDDANESECLGCEKGKKWGRTSVNPVCLIPGVSPR